MRTTPPRIVAGSFSAETYQLEGKLLQDAGEREGHQRYNEMTIVEIELDRSSIGSKLDVRPGQIVAQLTNGVASPAIGVVLDIVMPGSYVQEQKPAILTGLSVDGNGLTLPAGCSALYLDDYEGPRTELGGGRTVRLAAVFVPEACDAIESVAIHSEAGR